MIQPGFILLRVRQIGALMRLRPFDTSSAVGRSMERHRRIALSALVAFLARAVNIVSMLLVVRLTVGYLGEDRYGLLMTITSLSALAMFADLGLMYALSTLMARMQGSDDREASVAYVSTASAALIVAAAAQVAIFLAIYPFVDWGRALGAGNFASAEAGPAMFVLAIGTFAMLPLSVAAAVRRGLQQGYASSLWQLVMSVLVLIGTVIAIRCRAGLVLLAAIPLSVQILLGVGENMLLYFVQYPSIRPRLSAISRKALSPLLALGLSFYVISLATAVGFGTDNIVLAKILGVSAVTRYSIPQRLCFLLPTVLSFVLAPLWPAYGEAHARGDIQWVKNTLRRSSILTLAIVIPFTLVFVIFGKVIVKAWVGHAADPSYSLLAAIGIACAIMSTQGIFSVLLNGIGAVRFLLIASVSMAIINLPVSILLTRWIGVSGVAWGSALATLVCLLVPSYIYARRMFRTTGRQPEPSGLTGADDDLEEMAAHQAAAVSDRHG
jgi:O-antigen/teichoic acid export membrane protein